MTESAHRLEVNVTGAFLTGHPLRIGLAEYAGFQAVLGEELAGGSAGWAYRHLLERGVDTYGSGGGHVSFVPLVLAERLGDPPRARFEELHRERPEGELRWLRARLEGWRWDLRTVSVGVYDLGVAVISAGYEVEAPAGMEPHDVAKAVEEVGQMRVDPASGRRSPVAEAFQALASESAVELADALGRCEGAGREDRWFAPLIAPLRERDASDGGDREQAPGRLLWLHPIFVLGGGESELRSLAQPYRSRFSGEIDHWDGFFSPGIATSVIVLADRRPGYEGPPVRLTFLMWAYYALFMQMDRGLLAMFDRDDRPGRESLGALEQESQVAFATFMRVQEARARLASALTDLAGGQLRIWEEISTVQKFNDLGAAVEQKLGVLQGLADRRVQEAAASRASRSGRILSALTALTVVTVTVALVGSFIGTPADSFGHVGLRALIVVAAFLVALLLYRETQREAGRRRRR